MKVGDVVKFDIIINEYNKEVAIDLVYCPEGISA